MGVETALWRVGPAPEKLSLSSLVTEQVLENMIVAAPDLLSSDWMLIGRQADTGFRGRIDLLAIAPDASLVLIELKREQTPREVITQALDYAGWVETLDASSIKSIYAKFKPEGDLASDFYAFHGINLEENALNASHQIVIVASSLDTSTERIVNYLSARDLAINVLFFQVFSSGQEQILSRSWLVDPSERQTRTSTREPESSEPWNGEYYGSFGEGVSRSWRDAVEFGFFSAGGGNWYSRTLKVLKPGDRIWVNIPATGYVGVGRVSGLVVPATEFYVDTPDGERSVLEVAKRGTYHKEFKDDPQRCEYFVPVQWLSTVESAAAIYELGFFGNQNSVCAPTKPRWRSTVESLKRAFKRYDAT